MDYQRKAYDEKYRLLPKIISEWLAPYGGVDGKILLDFGCGEATTAIGFTRQHLPRRVVGVDIMPDVHLCLPLAREQLGLDRLPDNLDLRQIAPGPLEFADDSFDVVYSWSVFEHVDRRLMPSVLGDLRRVMRRTGLLFIQIEPLFYSAAGSHLSHLLPEPWGHLAAQHDSYRQGLRAACPDQLAFETLWSTYSTLNRITAPELLDLLRATGFAILRQHATEDVRAIPAQLAHAFNPKALLTRQMVVLAARAPGIHRASPRRRPDSVGRALRKRLARKVATLLGRP